MTVTAAFANQAKLDLLSQLSGHTIKCALYTQAAATLDKNSTVYTTTGEVTGAGYTAGGKTNRPSRLKPTQCSITPKGSWMKWRD